MVLLGLLAVAAATDGLQSSQTVHCTASHPSGLQQVPRTYLGVPGPLAVSSGRAVSCRSLPNSSEAAAKARSLGSRRLLIFPQLPSSEQHGSSHHQSIVASVTGMGLCLSTNLVGSSASLYATSGTPPAVLR